MKNRATFLRQTPGGWWGFGGRRKRRVWSFGTFFFLGGGVLGFVFFFWFFFFFFSGFGGFGETGLIFRQTGLDFFSASEPMSVEQVRQVGPKVVWLENATEKRMGFGASCFVSLAASVGFCKGVVQAIPWKLPPIGKTRFHSQDWPIGGPSMWPWVKTQIVPPVNLPIPATIGSKMGGACTYQPKWDPMGFDHHRHFSLRECVFLCGGKAPTSDRRQNKDPTLLGGVWDLHGMKDGPSETGTRCVGQSRLPSASWEVRFVASPEKRPPRKGTPPTKIPPQLLSRSNNSPREASNKYLLNFLGFPFRKIPATKGPLHREFGSFGSHRTAPVSDSRRPSIPPAIAYPANGQGELFCQGPPAGFFFFFSSPGVPAGSPPLRGGHPHGPPFAEMDTCLTGLLQRNSFCNHLKHGFFTAKIKLDTTIDEMQCSGV